jgi:hypothetical protein
MPRFIRDFLFDHPEQHRDMLTVGALLAGVAIVYMTMNFVSTLPTDTNSSAYANNKGISQQLRAQSSASPY